MANSKILGLIGVAFALLASTALAGISSVVNITEIEVSAVGGGDPRTWLAFASTPTGKPGCGTSAEVEVVGTVEAVRAMTSAASAAYLAGRPVKVYFDGSCNGTYSRVTGVFMLQ